MIVEARGKRPQIGKDCFIAPNATIIGDVIIGDRCSIWYNVVIRGDVFPIRIGDEVNIQDGAVLHGTYERAGVVLENRVTVGHLAMLHGCHIGEACLVGMSSIVMDKVTIGDHCLIAAGSLVVENFQIAAKQMVMGRPAKAVRPLSLEEIGRLEQSADNYLMYKTWYDGK